MIFFSQSATVHGAGPCGRIVGMKLIGQCLIFFSFLASKKKQKEFDEIGSDLSSSLIKQMNGQINSWAIRCNYHQFLKQTYTVYPLKK